VYATAAAAAGDKPNDHDDEATITLSDRSSQRMIDETTSCCSTLTFK